MVSFRPRGFWWLKEENKPYEKSQSCDHVKYRWVIAGPFYSSRHATLGCLIK